MLHNLAAGMTLAVFALMACTRTNPAFQEGKSGGTESNDDSSADTTVDESTDASSSETDPSATSEVSTGTAPETGGEECVLPSDESLRFKMYSQVELEGCDSSFDDWFLIDGASAGGRFSAQFCDEGCIACPDVPPVELETYPADLTNLANAMAGRCVHAEFSELVTSDVLYCAYEKLMITTIEGQEEFPILIGSSGDGDPPPNSHDFIEELAAFWDLVETEVCDCPLEDDCCDPDDPPTLYDFDIGTGTPLTPGETKLFTVFDQSWAFTPYQAEYIDSCGADLDVSWLLRLNY